MQRLLSAGLALSLFGFVGAVQATARPETPLAQQAAPAPPATPGAPSKDDDVGVPITNAKVKEVCGVCHKADAKGRLSRISFRRTTPEGWQLTIRRMATLNKVDLDPAEAREILKYLSDNLGLAPEESKPAAFEVERRLIDYKYTANNDTNEICSSCHSMGRVLYQRRTAKEWDYVVAMHRGYYPLVDSQVFRRFGPAPTTPGPDGRPPDSRHPMDKALAHLKTAFPFATPEWTAWAATMRSPRLEGTWLLAGNEPGQGPIYGTVTIAAGATADEFTTDISYTYARGAKSGTTVSRKGRVMVYTGHQWRGRSMVGGDDATSLREVMEVERDWQSISGRWFTGAYDELGPDVTLTRIGREVSVAGLDRLAARRGSTGETVRIYGANLPASLAARDIDFGRGVTVTRVVSSTPSLATVEIAVAADAVIGSRDLFVAGATKKSALAVYDKVDYIAVTPNWNMARLGGAVYPKQLAQFDAMAFSNGTDGKPNTKDDQPVGLVDATWSIEEYAAVYGDDDLKYVGKIDAKSGLFTPALDGTNPERPGNRNNMGDVWVVATHTPAGGGAAMRARAHLVVTVPIYQRWDFSVTGGGGDR